MLAADESPETSPGSIDASQRVGAQAGGVNDPFGVRWNELLMFRRQDALGRDEQL